MSTNRALPLDDFRLGRRLWIAVALAATVALTACSIPVDNEPNRIDPDQLLPELTQTTTTTTTTTVPQTVPPSTDPGETEPSTTTTTTAPPLTPVNVSIFYTISLSDDLVSFQRSLPGPVVTLQQVVVELEEPIPDLTTSYNLRSSVRPGLIADLGFDRAVLTVSLDRATFDEMPDDQKQRAIAQIVLTFTSFVTPDAGAVGAVRFVIDGEGIPVFVPATGANSEPGAELKFADFQPWIASSAPPTTTTTTTTTPPSPGTTVAPSSP